jgi:transcriptional regulator with XRE-family HTH domain
MSNFKSRFKELRLKEGLTQEELAKRLKISRSSVGMYETGEREPDFETLEVIADFYNIDMNYLLGKTDVNKIYNFTAPETIAAHHDGEEWTEEELKAIEDFKAFVKSRRK